MEKEKLGGLIGARRRELGLTQRELADRLHVTDQWGDPIIYQMETRWNRLTYEGVVTACTGTQAAVTGGMMEQVGSSMALDGNQETGDALFGYAQASCEYSGMERDPYGDGWLLTLDFWRRDGAVWNAEFLLTVEKCRAFTTADWDDDGVTELLVRTRWQEKPYTVYDLVDGEIVESWPDTVPEEIAELLA